MTKAKERPRKRPRIYGPLLPKKNWLGRPRPQKYYTHTPWSTVLAMREDFWGGMGLPQVAIKYNLSHSYTWQICHGYRRRYPEKSARTLSST